MPHAIVKFIPGVNTTETPVLNASGLSQTNLVRYVYDTQQGALVQKLGGWTLYSQTPAPARVLWAWEDTNANTHLAYGTQNITGLGYAQLGVVTGGTVQDITPRTTTDSVTPAAASTSGSPLIVITDATTPSITEYDSVYIATQMSIGGVVLFGLYACDPDGYIGATAFTVQAVGTLGEPLPATSTSTAPTLPEFSTTSGQTSVSVTLANHGYSVGSTFPVLTPTTVGGTTFDGQYIVQSVVSSSQFTISSNTTPSATATGYLNGGNASFTYCFGVGTIPTGTGYGIGGYGSGGYGTGSAVVPSTGTPVMAVDWVLANWGQVLLACNINPTASFQPIYQWDPTGGSPTATVISSAPAISEGIFVAMPQRQIISWGSSFDGVQDPLLVRWCDIGNFNSWVGTVTNQAGSYRIPTGSKIVGGVQGPQQGLLWTDISLWSMQYIGQPYVYSFNEIGTGCGLNGHKAYGVINGSVFWMGPSQFFVLGANGVEPVPCPVWDVVFQNLDTRNVNKIRCGVNSRFNEIAWYYPTLTSGGEVAAYVKYNTVLNVWDYGSLARSAWIDQSVLGPPIGADPNALKLYQHETSTDADGVAMTPSFQSGYAALSDGDNKMFVDQVWPDMKFGYYQGAQNATVNLTFYVADYPEQTPQVFGPYPFTASSTFVSPRFRGRLVSVGLSGSDVGSFWRIGGIRYRVTPDGVF